MAARMGTNFPWGALMVFLHPFSEESVSLAKTVLLRAMKGFRRFTRAPNIFLITSLHTE